MNRTRRKDTGVPGNGGWFDRSRDQPRQVTLTGGHTRHMPDLMVVSPECVRVLDTITVAGGHPYLVGGCVRDALMGRGGGSKDIDIEVYGLDADMLAEALATTGKVDETGRSFAVFKTRLGAEDFDVALPRTETKTGDGHRGFTVVPDPHASTLDATRRRDFTINALMFDPATGTLLDHHGGLEDLRAGVIRHTSDAFGEDPLRVLRAVQFAGRFDFTIANETLNLCRSLSDQFDTLPAERVWGEFQKIGRTAVSPSASLRALEDTGWLQHFPQLAAIRGVQQDARWHPEGDVFTHAGLSADVAARLADEAGLDASDREVVVLAALCHDFGKTTHTQQQDDGRITSHGHAEAGEQPVRDFLAGMGAPTVTIEKVARLTREHMVVASVQGAPSRRVVRRLANRLAPATIGQWALVHRADRGGRGPASHDPDMSEWLVVAENTRAPLLTGEHLIGHGLKPGPHFKPLLEAALAAQDEGEFTDTNGAVEWLERNVSR